MGRVSQKIGRRFGRIVVLAHAIPHETGVSKYLCRCDCGNETIVFGQNLSETRTKSCGCLARDVNSLAKSTHGMSGTPTYLSWSKMIRRCHNPNSTQFRYYGGRGIVVCNQWRESFEAFYSDMGVRPSGRHTLDRIDPDGDYVPSNCRWATWVTQARNRRNNRMLAHDGETKTLSEWAEEANMNCGTLSSRLRRGWSFVDAIAKPVRDMGQKRAPSDIR